MVVYGCGLRHRRYLNAYLILNVVSAQGRMEGHKRGEPLFYGQVLSISIKDELAIVYRQNKTHRTCSYRIITKCLCDKV